MIPIDWILEAGCKATGTTPEALWRKGRATRYETACRTFIAAKMRAEGYSWPRIGRELGRHHSTIMYLVRDAVGRKVSNDGEG